MQPSEKPSPFSSYQITLIALLALLQFTVVLDFMVISPLGDILMKSLSVNPKQFGLIVSSYAFSAGISGILAAGFADKFDRKKILMFFYIGFVLGTIICGLANTYEMLVVARIITGLFGGVIASITAAIVTDIFLPNQRGRVMGFVQMAFGISQVAGIPIGLYLANIWDWHAPFIMIVCFAAILGMVVMWVMKPITKHLDVQNTDNPFKHLWNTVRNKQYRIGFMSTAFLSIGGFLMMPFGSVFLVNNVGIAQSKLPLVFMITGIGSLIILPIIGRLSDKINRIKLFTIGSVWAMIMVAIYTNIGISPLWQVIIINMLLFMGIMSRMIPSQALTSMLPEMRDRGAFMSINASLQQMAGGLASVIAGFIVVQNDKSSPIRHYDTLGYISIVVMAICIYLVYRVYKIVESRR